MEHAPSIRIVAAPAPWLAALVEGDDTFTAEFAVPVAPGWAGFPEALPFALDAARERPDDPWGPHLVLDGDGTLVGFGGFKGLPADGAVELGYAVAPDRQRRGIATEFVRQLLERAREAGVATVVAHTLAEENPSTSVLRRSGFERTAELEDEGMAVWRWERAVEPGTR